MQPGAHREHYSVVYKFGGSSVRDAERLREVAAIVCNLEDHLPVVVLSASKHGRAGNFLLV